MKNILKKLIIILYMPIVFLGFNVTHEWGRFAFAHAPVILTIIFILLLISLFIVITEWESNEKTLPVIQILMGLLPFTYMFYSLAQSLDFFNKIVSSDLFQYTTIPSIIFIVSGIKGIKLRKINIKSAGEINITFKKVILILFLSILLVSFIPINSKGNLISKPFGFSNITILTFISLFIVITEWNSNEKTLPVIQILIGLAPFISIFILGVLEGFFAFLWVFNGFLPYMIIPVLIFIFSGTRGLLSNAKKNK